MKPDIILVGGGGHCRTYIDVIEQEGRFTITGIVALPATIKSLEGTFPVIIRC